MTKCPRLRSSDFEHNRGQPTAPLVTYNVNVTNTGKMDADDVSARAAKALRRACCLFVWVSSRNLRLGSTSGLTQHGLSPPSPPLGSLTPHLTCAGSPPPTERYPLPSPPPSTWSLPDADKSNQWMRYRGSIKAGQKAAPPTRAGRARLHDPAERRHGRHPAAGVPLYYSTFSRIYCRWC